MSQTRASIPYVTAFTPQENSNVSPNGSMSKLTILQPFGVNPDKPPHSREAKDSLVQLECTTLEEFVLLGKRLGRDVGHHEIGHGKVDVRPTLQVLLARVVQPSLEVGSVLSHSRIHDDVSPALGISDARNWAFNTCMHVTQNPHHELRFLQHHHERCHFSFTRRQRNELQLTCCPCD